MFSQEAKNLMEALISDYKKTGKNNFDVINYAKIQNLDSAIDELTSKGLLTENDDIIGTISINFYALKN